MRKLTLLLALIGAMVGMAFAGLALAAGGNSPTVKQRPCQAEQGQKSKQSTALVGLTFQNDSASSVNIYWLDFGGNRVLYSTLGPGAGYVQYTFPTHPWVVTDSANTCLSIWVATDRPGTVTIN